MRALPGALRGKPWFGFVAGVVALIVPLVVTVTHDDCLAQRPDRLVEIGDGAIASHRRLR